MVLIDYENQNYCSTCDVKLPKEITRCPNCNWLVRTRAIKVDESKVVRY